MDAARRRAKLRAASAANAPTAPPRSADLIKPSVAPESKISAARAGTQYSLQCTRLAPAVGISPINDRVFCYFALQRTESRIHFEAYTCRYGSCIERVGQDHTGPRLALAGAESRRAGRAAVGDEVLVCRASACPRCEALGFGEAPKAKGRGAVPIGSMNDKGTHPIVVDVIVPPLLTSDNSSMALRARDYR